VLMMPLGCPWDKSALLGYQLKISPLGVPAPSVVTDFYQQTSKIRAQINQIFLAR